MEGGEPGAAARPEGAGDDPEDPGQVDGDDQGCKDLQEKVHGTGAGTAGWASKRAGVRRAARKRARFQRVMPVDAGVMPANVMMKRLSVCGQALPFPDASPCNAIRRKPK